MYKEEKNNINVRRHVHVITDNEVDNFEMTTNLALFLTL